MSLKIKVTIFLIFFYLFLPLENTKAATTGVCDMLSSDNYGCGSYVTSCSFGWCFDPPCGWLLCPNWSGCSDDEMTICKFWSSGCPSPGLECSCVYSDSCATPTPPTPTPPPPPPSTGFCNASIVPCGTTGTPTCQFCHIFVLLNNIINYILTCITPLAAGLMIVIGGFMLVTARDDRKRFEDAKKIITAAVIGIVIILTAWLLLNTLLQAMGVANWTGLGSWWQIDCNNSSPSPYDCSLIGPGCEFIPMAPCIATKPNPIPVANGVCCCPTLSP